MAVLLIPQLAIDRAAIQQSVMRREIHDLALVQHQDGIRLHQGRQPMADDDHGAVTRDIP